MRALDRFGVWARGLTGWRRFLFAFLAGAFSALGFAPLGFIFAILLGFAALLILLDGADQSPHPYRKAFVAGWAFAFGQYLIGWHWIGYAFMVDPSAHLWQMPFAILALTAGLALYAGIACVLAVYFWQDGPARLLVFAVLYAAGEWVRGHALSGFPWNLPAYSWRVSWPVMQSLSLMGAYGLSFLTILLGASLAEFCAARRRFAAPLVMIILFAGLGVYGALRLTAPVTDVPGTMVRLVQPDVPQNEKYVRRYVARNWQRLIDLSSKPGAVTHIVWPEAAPPFLLARSGTALDEITLLTNGRSLITGAVRVQPSLDANTFYNSLYIFGPGGRPLAVYDKFHLVPFGEYVPFAGLLSRFGISKLTQGPEGFASGDGPHVYAVPGAPDMTPLICYEIIFPGAVTARQRPGWLVNITDDSWFGPWAGPRQHLLIARSRAIEEGLPVARAANTGISAMIDPFGRVTASLDLGRMGVVDAPLPRALPPTFYADFGDAIFALMLLVSIALAFVLVRKDEPQSI